MCFLYDLNILPGLSADGSRPHGGGGSGPLRFGRPWPSPRAFDCLLLVCLPRVRLLDCLFACQVFAVLIVIAVLTCYALRHAGMPEVEVTAKVGVQKAQLAYWNA